LTGGLIYFALYLTLLGVSVYHLVESFTKNSSLLKFTSSVVLVGIFLISTFSYTFYLVIIEFFLLAHLGILSAFATPIKSTDLKHSTLFSFLIVPVLFIGVHSFKELVADYQVSCSVNNKTIKIGEKLHTFKIYHHLNEENPQFLFNYALSLMKAKQFEEAIKQLNTAKQYSSYYQIYYAAGICYELIGKPNDAEQEYLHSSELCPSMFQPKYALFRLYQRLNKQDKSKIIAQNINQMRVKVNSPDIEKIKNDIKKFLSSPIQNP
jgi:tetratricopeptide (TPR) repeat protein